MSETTVAISSDWDRIVDQGMQAYQARFALGFAKSVVASSLNGLVTQYRIEETRRR